MKAMPNEPSMEEILSSIKRIIAEEDVPAQGARAPRRTTAQARTTADEAEQFADDDQILELTEALTGEADSDAALEEEAVMAMAARPSATAKAESKPGKASRARPAPATASTPLTAAATAVMSDTSADAARESLVNLSKLLVRSDDGPSNTLEGLVREMLRPMLKEWLDANLPELVEAMVKREIDRITGRV
ncbi:MAG: hypothetical protein BGP16_04800 [Sphingobium sp. 66-54]|nr:MAG: hypothetical protein BGP16_04800 [Sphingobium sp. 66-54]